MIARPTHAPDVSALLLELSRRGVELHRRGDRLAYDAPRGVIGDLLPDLARFKPQLLELLAQAPKAPTANGFTGTARGTATARSTASGETVARAPGTPGKAACGAASSGAPLDGLAPVFEARAHIAQLERRLGRDGARRAIVRAWRALERCERERPQSARRFWGRLSGADRHALATCAALLDAGEAPGAAQPGAAAPEVNP